jgi:hypothetical protein
MHQSMMKFMMDDINDDSILHDTTASLNAMFSFSPSATAMIGGRTSSRIYPTNNNSISHSSCSFMSNMNHSLEIFSPVSASAIDDFYYDIGAVWDNTNSTSCGDFMFMDNNASTSQCDDVINLKSEQSFSSARNDVNIEPTLSNGGLKPVARSIPLLHRSSTAKMSKGTGTAKRNRTNNTTTNLPKLKKSKVIVTEVSSSTDLKTKTKTTKPKPKRKVTETKKKMHKPPRKLKATKSKQTTTKKISTIKSKCIRTLASCDTDTKIDITQNSKMKSCAAKPSTAKNTIGKATTLDTWQQQFLNFLTYPSDHIVEKTGQRVPLRDTIIWGRQKVVWTTPLLHPQKAVSENTTTPAAKKTPIDHHPLPSIFSSSRCGGNHLSHQLVIQAAVATANANSLATSESSKLSIVNENDEHHMKCSVKRMKKKKAFMIRRTNKEALWYHGGSTMNQNLGQWLQQQRKSYQLSSSIGKTSVRKELSMHRLEQSTDLASSPHRYTYQYGGTILSDSTSNTRKSEIPLTREQKERIYTQIEQSFHFHLLQLSGIDVQNVLPEATMFVGRVHGSIIK